MASDSSAASISKEERRWVVIGVCLTKVLTPALRNVLATEIAKWYQALCQPPDEIDRQSYGRHKVQFHPSTLHLNYKNINNNDALKKPHTFDYAVKHPLSLAKLFVQPFMSKFTGFDQTMDISAALSVICEAAPFAGASAHAKIVRSNIRNEWAHCNFANWTEAKFTAAFQTMETLLKNVYLSPEDEKKLCDELSSWKDKGLSLCFGQPVDVEILTLLRDKVDELYEAVQTWSLEKEQRASLLSNIYKMQSNLKEEIDDLCERLEKCETQGNNNSLRIKDCEVLANKNLKDIKLLDKKFTTELSRYIIKEERIPYVFSAPARNRFFAGRTEEIQELKRILKIEETLNEKTVRVAAVSGLGGIGKTSLVCEYAHQMKDFYKGGVYWFSAEDDARLSKSVNAIAVEIGALLESFDLTLPSMLKKISTTHDPCLIVLDCLDQLDLSSNMMEFLSFPSHENIVGHFLVLTRRNPIRLVNEVPIFEEISCLQLKCMQSDEAKQFLFSRSKVIRDESVESVAECLCEELGRLPLALEQAGAYIHVRRCSISMYLEQYKAEHLRLLSRQQARTAGNDLPERLAVHTTWLINIENIKKSLDGQAAVRFMNACSFFDGNEIEEELINVGAPEVEDVAFRKCVLSPLGCREVLKLLTDFSLFTYAEAHSVSTHRLLQEIVRGSLDPKSKAESFCDAVRMLAYAFSKCSSPSDHVSLDERNDKEQNISFSNPPSSRSRFYMWSRFCTHGHNLRRYMEDLLVGHDSICLDSVWFPETTKILHECAVHLSANHKQEEAKRTLNFAYRILDWVPSSEYETVKKNVSDNSLFPLPIPLPKPFQYQIPRYCMAPFVSGELRSEKRASEASDGSVEAREFAPEASDPEHKGSSISVEKQIEKLLMDAKRCCKGQYKEALDAYSSALHLAKDCKRTFNPLLLIDRATVYIKLGQYENALKDANEYITRCPDCWMGYARKALALSGLNENVSAEIAAALAFYHNRGVFSDFLPFKESFFGLQERIFICDSVDDLREAIFLGEIEADVFKILVMGSEEYVLNFEECVQPWNNCILVGTRNDSSVSLKSDHVISLLKCMLANLSFNLINGHVNCLPGSFVKMLKCNFTSYDTIWPAVVTKGEFNAEHCNFTENKSSGLRAQQGNAVIVGCSFSKNQSFGLEVCKGGTLLVKSSSIRENRECGLMIGPEATRFVAINCSVHDNTEAGIGIMNSKNVTLVGNNVFDNYDHGIWMANSEVDIKENKCFDNCLWGIWSMSNSCCNMSNNRVFRNKAGGVRVGYRFAGDFFPSVVERNDIYNNFGPGLVERGNEFEEGLLFNSLQFAKCRDNEIYDNRENENVDNLNCSVPYCSHCRKRCEPEWCGTCFTAVYCNKSCQDNHWVKHVELCKVLREKSSYLISSMERANYHDAKKVEGEKEIGPKFSSPPRRNGRRFVVKVHTAIRTTSAFTDMLYDRSLELCEVFESKVIDELLEEYGLQCERQFVEKKLFFYCLFENNGQLRLFTNEFPEFQNW